MNKLHGHRHSLYLLGELPRVICNMHNRKLVDDDYGYDLLVTEAATHLYRRKLKVAVGVVVAHELEKKGITIS